jgi:hypothetical protein
MPLAHIGGVPVEEGLLPIATALMLSGAWLNGRRRRLLDRRRARTTERSPR